jgi:hypothetical protein
MLAVVLFLHLSNPSYDHHVNHVAAVYGRNHPIRQLIVPPEIVDQWRYNDYFVFSTTSALDGSTTTLGALGMVMILNKDLVN